MAEAARSCKHYVSDCLAERHPYDVKKGFGGQRARDAGRVFNGLYPQGVDKLMADLADPSVGDEERARAVHHLYAYSASQEEKITMLRNDIVGRVVRLLRGEPRCSPMLENQCFLLLRSLAIVPQGCYPLVRRGGAAACLRAIMDPEEAQGARLEARTSATSALRQIAFDYAGVRWLLGAEDCEEMRLRDDGEAEEGEEGEAEAPPSPEELVGGMVHILQTADSPEACRAPICLHAVRALEQMTLVSPGIKAMEAGDNLACLAALLQLFGSGPTEGPEETQFLTSLMTTVWNTALDQPGVEAMEPLEIPEAILDVFLWVQANHDAVPLTLQRSVLGAFSAVSKLTSVKHRGHEAVAGKLTQVEVLINYIRNINKHINTARKQDREPSADVIAISKNAVQCVRLSSEVKPVRDITHKYIDGLANLDYKEAFYLRRQLYFSTIWEVEYDASV